MTCVLYLPRKGGNVSLLPCFLKREKKDILRELMFLCNIFPRLQGLKGSSISRSDLELDFSAKQNDD